MAVVVCTENYLFVGSVNQVDAYAGQIFQKKLNSDHWYKTIFFNSRLMMIIWRKLDIYKFSLMHFPKCESLAHWQSPILTEPKKNQLSGKQVVPIQKLLLETMDQESNVKYRLTPVWTSFKLKDIQTNCYEIIIRSLI